MLYIFIIHSKACFPMKINKCYNGYDTWSFSNNIFWLYFNHMQLHLLTNFLINNLCFSGSHQSHDDQMIHCDVRSWSTEVGRYSVSLLHKNSAVMHSASYSVHNSCDTGVPAIMISFCETSFFFFLYVAANNLLFSLELNAKCNKLVWFIWLRPLTMKM